VLILLTLCKFNPKWACNLWLCVRYY